MADAKGASKFHPNDVWAFVKSGVQKNLMVPAGEPAMDMKEYMGYYTAIHEYCLTQKAVRGSVFPQDSNNGGAHLLGAKLYINLRNHLVLYLQTLRRHIDQRSESDLLTTYLSAWKQYQAGAQRNSRMMAYLNRHWCRRVIDEGADDVREIYPLHIALWEDVVLDVTQDIVRQAIATLVKRKRNGQSVDAKLVKDILDASRRDEKDDTKSVPDIYQLLLDPNRTETDEQLLLKTSQTGHRHTAEFLLDQGISPDVHDSAGRTPLSHAAERNDIQLISLLLAHNASINTQDEDGVTPLFWAVKSQIWKVKAASLLLAKGADPMIKDRSGETPLAWAKKAVGHHRVVEILTGVMQKLGAEIPAEVGPALPLDHEGVGEMKGEGAKSVELGEWARTQDYGGGAQAERES